MAAYIDDELGLDPEELRRVFVAEAEQQLGVFEEGLLALELRPGDGEELKAVFRALHTIKGSASMLGYDAVRTLAHAGEDVLDIVRSGGAPVTGEVVSLLLSVADGLRRMVATLAGGDEPEAASYATLGAELASWRPGRGAPEGREDRTGSAPPEAAPALEPGAARASLPDPSTADLPPRGPSERDAFPSAPTRRSLRVDVTKLDRLLEVANEIALARRIFAGRLAGTASPAQRELAALFEDTDNLVGELHDAVMDLRMVPVGPVLRRFGRAVRDAAASTGKQVHFTVEGADVEVDTSIVEQLSEPLTHLVRNAVDHGIEAPAARTAAGKDAVGVLTVRVRRDPASLVIEVTDDGGGLIRGKLERRARAMGVADPEALGDEALHALIFEPGFSTAERVSELSGRGVGMDAVRRAIEGLRGSVQVASREGVGTTVTVRTPLTLSVVEGLEVRVGRGTFIVPLETVEECREAPTTTPGDRGILELEERVLPWVRLRGLFQSPGEAPDREQMLIVRHGGSSAGLLVDALLGSAETMVRPLAAGLGGTARFGGSAVLEDGTVGLVLDVAALLRDLTADRNGAAILHPPTFLH
jgi:two-component system chemotaxis sensor kinase CheA